MTTGNDRPAEPTAANGTAVAEDATANDEGLAAGALTSQADFDKLILTRFASVPLAVLNRRTDWYGLTAKQEEEAHLLHKQQALAESEREMDEIRERADRLMERLDEQEREVRRKLAEADARAIVLRDGRRVLVGEHGEYIDDATGDTLEGNDKAEAQRLRKKDSETVAERRDLDNRLIKIREAQKSAREAKDIASQDGRNLRPDQMKEQEREARDKADEAEAVAADVEARDKQTEADATAGSTLTGADALAAFGLGASQSGRTVSFAGTLDAKDNRASALQNEFTSRVVGKDGSDAPQSACSASSDNTSNKLAPNSNQ